jgi:glycosyltransferase involved in cell wall biosynthesis
MPEARLDFGALVPHVGVFGGVRRLIEIGNALVRRGHRYALYHQDGTRPEWLEFHGDVRPLAALRDTAHDVVICADAGLAAELESARARAKLYYCVHKNLPEPGIARHAGWTLLANSSALGAALWRRYRVRAEDAIGGVNLEMFRPLLPDVRAQPEPFRILAYGRMSRAGKGTTTAIRTAERVAALASRRWPAWGGTLAHPVQLVLFDHVGPGNERDPRPLVRCRIPYEFHLNLPQPELARLYTSCDVLLSAERRAGWNNTVAEAMAAGLPVVCTRAGTQDLAVQGETARVVGIRHAWFLSRAVLALWRDRDLRARLRRNALARVHDYSWERVADRIEQISRERLAAHVQGSPARTLAPEEESSTDGRRL